MRDSLYVDNQDNPYLAIRKTRKAGDRRQVTSSLRYPLHCLPCGLETRRKQGSIGSFYSKPSVIDFPYLSAYHFPAQ